ncbi:MAG TPA: hypothetical protein VEC06_18700 [Paucimonas sp.]|nr:hypothetical protein [Paucimonas sp.]
MTDARPNSTWLFTGCALAGMCIAFSAPGFAQTAAANANLKFSGFMTVTGGKIIGGRLQDSYEGPAVIDGTACPCYTADWGNAGVYSKSFSLKPESRVGVQVNYAPSPNLNFGAQIVSRGSDAKPNLQWGYAGYSFNDNWEAQVGRKRIPLYYYSDFQDIGLAYPWVNAPPELYGWEATNYNGGSVRHRGDMGNANYTASAFAGKETVKDSLYQQLYYPGTTKVTWSRLAGADFELSNGPFTTRLVYMQARVRTQNPGIDLDTSADLNAYGIAANADFDDWFVLSELTQLTRKFIAERYKVSAPALTLGAGIRLGKWTPFFNYARYIERTDDRSQYAPQSFRRTSVTLRYDIDLSSALKAQFDRHIDITNNFGGNVTLFRVSYDRKF